MVLPIAQGQPLVIERGQSSVEDRERRFLFLRDGGYWRKQRDKKKRTEKIGR
jgi:hypothetical protein